MELEQLRILAVLAEEKSYTAAARRLYISHSTVSRAVSALEEELGAELVNRGNRFFGMTAAGEKLCAGARDILEAEERLINEVKETAAERHSG